MNEEQKRALDLVTYGRNVFLTGAAGTGKTYTVQSIVQWARAHSLNVCVTATTGAAAILIGGKTIHSAMGIGLGTKSVDALVHETRTRKKWLVQKLLSMNLLIVDEVSMLTAELLDKISKYLMQIRNRPVPMGGVQVVFVGDFHQLGPVDGDFCYKAGTWRQLKVETVKLEEVHRQKGDTDFQSILMRARTNTLTEKDIEILKNTGTKTWDGSVKPTRLFAKNASVDTINANEYRVLVENGAREVTYKTQYSGEKAKTWASSLNVKEEVVLCEGAQVMLTWNMSVDDHLVNGTRGVIEEVKPHGVIIRLLNDQVVFIQMQKIASEEDAKVFILTMPIRLAYALSIHKSQGCTLDAVELDLGESIFADGQAYTALSRAKSLDAIRVTAIDKRSFKTNADVMEFYNM